MSCIMVCECDVVYHGECVPCEWRVSWCASVYHGVRVCIMVCECACIMVCECACIMVCECACIMVCECACIMVCECRVSWCASVMSCIMVCECDVVYHGVRV